MLVWTNKAGLPTPVIDAIKSTAYKGGGDIGVTTLCGPPQIRLLKKRYFDAGEPTVIERDYADELFSLFGRIGHDIVEKADRSSLPECRIYMEINGWNVSGQFDSLDLLGDNTLNDYKFTSVYAVKGEPKVDWVQQTNCYGELVRTNGGEIDRLQIIAFLRDWSLPKSRREPDVYPSVQVKVVPIKMWKREDVLAFMEERVHIHQNAQARYEETGELFPCTDEERWLRGSKWAVHATNGKTTTKTAAKLCDSKEEADQYASKKPPPKGKNWVIMFREGVYVRCADYCDVSPVCPQYQKTGE